MFNTGFSAVGNRDGWNPIFRDERTYTLSTNISKLKGRHDIKGGYLMNFFYLDHWQPETGNPRGQFDFSGPTTALNATGAQTGNFYNQFASFLMGYVGTAGKSVQNELMTAREWQHSLYVRDRWTPTGKLTFDFGLRYELYPIMTARRRPRRRPPRPDQPGVRAAARRADRRPWRQPAEQRHEDELEQLRAAARRDLPPRTTRRWCAPATG